MNLEKNAANFVPLSPLSFIERTKDVRITSYNVCYTKLLRQGPAITAETIASLMIFLVSATASK